MIAVLDIRTPHSAVQKLESLGFEAVLMPAFECLAEPVASHPDMLIFPFGDKIICHRKYYETANAQITRIADGKELVLSDEAVSASYPHDILFNSAVIGNNLLCNTDFTSSSVLDTAKESGLEVHNIKQGYAKCSCCTVSDNAVITSDPTVYRAALEIGADVLFVDSGYVSLPGYNYGFIGGSSGIYEDKIFFCGDVGLHPDGDNIIRFCKSHGKAPVILYDGPLLDIGSIFFI